MLQRLDDAIQSGADDPVVGQILRSRFPERPVSGEFLNRMLTGFAAFDVQLHRLAVNVGERPIDDAAEIFGSGACLSHVIQLS